MRWKALAPLAVLLMLVAVASALLVDTVVRRTVEAVGAELVGAKVDVAEADVRLGDGFVTLRGLQVTNPDAPMTNLFQADEIVADVRVRALLEKKVYVDTIAVRGVRFGTPRETSGALDRPGGRAGLIRRQVDQWREQVRVPEFSLAGLGQVVDVEAIHPESLQTRTLAVALAAEADSSRRAWEERLRALDPTPAVDSGRALLARLSGASVRTLGVTGLAQAVRSARGTLDQVTSARDGVAQLEGAVVQGVRDLRAGVDGLAEASARDLAFARSLLRLPSLETPDLSPSLFGEFAADRIQSVLFWLQTVERYVPPGLNPRLRPGPARARRAGTSVQFPKAGEYPAFTVALAEVGLLIGTGAAAGRYEAEVQNLTSAPAVLGAPLRLLARRTEGTTGPRDVEFGALIDHLTERVRDSVGVRVGGITLPSVTLPGLGTTMRLGQGETQFLLDRVGDSLNGRWTWRAADVQWERAADTAAAAAVPARLTDFVSGVLAELRDVEVEIRVTGTVRSPRLAIRSTVGRAVARGLRSRLQAEIGAAEARIRAELDRLVAESVAEAEGRVREVEAGVVARVAGERAVLDQLEADIERRIAELARPIPDV